MKIQKSNSPSLNDCENNLLKLYEELHFNENPICQKCRKENPALTRPIGAWLVGNNFYRNKDRILFVGKNARGEPGETYGDFQFTFGDSRDRLWHKKWPYWSYTRAIAEHLYGNDSIENIAFTNIVKCNDSYGKDTTSWQAKNYCIGELSVIRKEAAVIRPTHIIFYTSWKYDDYIPKIFDTFTTVKSSKILIGKKEMPWLEAYGSLNKQKINILRIGHPERMKKSDYVSAVCEWVRQANSGLAAEKHA